MIKKVFVQPELTVVCINKIDVLTASIKGVYTNDLEDLAPDRRFDSWDEGY